MILNFAFSKSIHRNIEYQTLTPGNFRESNIHSVSDLELFHVSPSFLNNAGTIVANFVGKTDCISIILIDGKSLYSRVFHSEFQSAISSLDVNRINASGVYLDYHIL